MQCLAAKTAVDDLTLRIDEDIVGDAVNLVDGGSGTLPAFQVGDLQPRHLQLTDGLDPSRLLIVERHTYDLKALVVDFWASWCGPCRAEMPNVLEAYNRFHDKGFEVIGVSFDQKKEAWVKAIGQLKMPWMQISDLKGWECAAAPIYKINSIPDNILIDPQGKIIDRGLRGKALHTKLENLLNK